MPALGRQHIQGALETFDQFGRRIVGWRIHGVQLLDIKIQVSRFDVPGAQPVQASVVYGFIQIGFQRPTHGEPFAEFPKFYERLLHQVFRLVHVAVGQPAGIQAKWFVPTPEERIERRLLAPLQGLDQIVFVLILQRLRVLSCLKTLKEWEYPDFLKSKCKM